MTDRERILRAIRGESPDRIPWVPRLEFWYRGRRYSQSLPESLHGLSLPEVIERLGVGWYASIPDFTNCEATGGNVDRTLGLLRSTTIPYRTELEGVERRVTTSGRETVVEYETPVGSIRTASIFTEEMLQAGVSASWITATAIQQPRDIDVVGYIFSRIKVVPDPDGYLAFRRQVGEQGVAVAFMSGAACPLQHIMRTLMPVEDFFYAMSDCPKRIEWLAEQMEPYYRSIQDIAAESCAEVVLLGGNYSDSVTPPPFFRRHILPGLKSYAERLHGRGKYLMTHTDGENRNLFPLYVETGFDVADSICPFPMTRCRLDEIRAALQDRITIWGGVPSVLLCASSCKWEEFKHAIDELLDRYGHDSRFILGVSDMVTADAELDRVRYITERVSALS